MAPTAGRLRRYRGGRGGAIAQLGERVVRNDEVGGSIPPGSTTLRPSGYAWRSRAMPEERSVPGIAHLGEDGLQDATRYHLSSAAGAFGLRVAQPRNARRAKRARRSPLGRRRASVSRPLTSP